MWQAEKGVCADERRGGNEPAGLEGLLSSRQWNKAKKATKNKPPICS